MASLLSRLKKPKQRRKDSVDDVLRTESDEEVLLQELLQETSQPKRASTVVRQRKSPKKRRSSLPQWLTSTPPKQPEVDTLMLAAVASLGGGNLDNKGLVQAALRQGLEAIRGEGKVERSVREESERQLRGLLQGYGPLQALFEDQEITDIVVANHTDIRVLRKGQTLETPFSFRSKEEYVLFIRSLVTRFGQQLNEQTPILDLELESGCSLNVIDASVADGSEPKLSFHLSRVSQTNFFDMLQQKVLPPTLASWLAEVVASREVNLLVVGPRGAGKSLFISALLSTLSSEERVILIEPTPSIGCSGAQLERLRPRSGVVTTSELVNAALKRAPHRLVLGELLGDEVLTYLRALERGFNGSIASINAQSAFDGLWHLASLVEQYTHSQPLSVVRRISRSIDLLVVLRLIDGVPCLVELAELAYSQEEFVIDPLVCFLGQAEGKREWQLLRKNSVWMDHIEQMYDVNLSPGPGLSGVGS